jgi:hypothetical protein
MTEEIKLRRRWAGAVALCAMPTSQNRDMGHPALLTSQSRGMGYLGSRMIGGEL